jgi:Fic family protein
MRPPFKITPKINNLVAEISKLLGLLEATTLSVPNPKLRRKNRIRTIKSTLAIEGHTFTEDQITAVLENRRVLGTEKELLEVQNAIQLYDLMDEFRSSRSRDFLKAHKILMGGILASAGKYRSKNVGVLAGTKVKHLAPKPNMVPELMGKVFEWIKKEKEIHALILSSIVHYEIEFIHPFEDGNGRMGRYWQALILKEYDEFFKYVPIESLIERNQKDYYSSLERSDKTGESTGFIEFILSIISTTLKEMSSELKGVTNSFEKKMEKAAGHFGEKIFSRKDYMELFKNISSATASRDLKEAVEKSLLKKIGERNQTKYRFL